MSSGLIVCQELHEGAVLRLSRSGHSAFHPDTFDWTSDYLPLWSLHRVSDGRENDIDRTRYLGISMSVEALKAHANIYVQPGVQDRKGDGVMA